MNEEGASYLKEMPEIRKSANQCPDWKPFEFLT